MTARDRGRPRIVLPLIAAVAIGAGCSGPAVTRHADGEGILRINPGVGGNSVYAPGKVPWSVTFGGTAMCTDKGQRVTIESVSYDQAVPALAIVPMIRDVPAGPDRVPGQVYDPIGSALGSPPGFESDDSDYGGTWTQDVDGYVIDTKCHARGPDEAFDELQTVMDVSAEGAFVTTMRVRYRFDGREYESASEWRMVACGSAIGAKEAAIDDNDYCSSD
jgi:hypothetical protein